MGVLGYWPAPLSYGLHSSGYGRGPSLCCTAGVGPFLLVGLHDFTLIANADAANLRVFGGPAQELPNLPQKMLTVVRASPYLHLGLLFA